jgi:hypothetical protein
MFALSSAGFAIHGSHEHVALARGEVGRPRFEPDALREANVTSGLLFFDDDAGYELASEPGVEASHGVLAARRRGDDHDRVLYDVLGHPPTHHYIASAEGVLVPSWMPPGPGMDAWRFEAEGEWPPAAESDATTEVLESPDGCVGGGRLLAIRPRRSKEGTATLALPIPPTTAGVTHRGWTVAPRVFQLGGTGAATLSLVYGSVPNDATLLARWSWADAAEQPGCLDLPAQPIEFPTPPDGAEALAGPVRGAVGGPAIRVWMIVRASGGDVALDRLTLTLHR